VNPRFAVYAALADICGTPMVDVCFRQQNEQSPPIADAQMPNYMLRDYHYIIDHSTITTSNCLCLQAVQLSIYLYRKLYLSIYLYIYICLSICQPFETLLLNVSSTVKSDQLHLRIPHISFGSSHDHDQLIYSLHVALQSQGKVPIQITLCVH